MYNLTMEELKQAINTCGGLSQSARELGVTRQRLHNWLGSKQVPVLFCAAIESKFGVSRKLLRPSDWKAIWPDLEQSAT